MIRLSLPSSLVSCRIIFIFIIIPSFLLSIVSVSSSATTAATTRSLTTTTTTPPTTTKPLLIVSSLLLLHHHFVGVGGIGAAFCNNNPSRLLSFYLSTKKATTTTTTTTMMMRQRRVVPKSSSSSNNIKTSNTVSESSSSSSFKQQQQQQRNLPKSSRLQSSSSSSELLSLSGSSSSNNNNNNIDNNIFDLSSIKSNKGIYYGRWDDEPIKEKIVPLKISKNKKNHVWVKVYAISINPVDAKKVIGDKLPYNCPRLRKLCHNLIVANTRIGFDFSGKIVLEDSNHNNQFIKGQNVYGTMPPLVGSCAEYIQVPIDQIALAPTALTLIESAALPLVGLTAWQSLSSHIKNYHNNNKKRNSNNNNSNNNNNDDDQNSQQRLQKQPNVLIIGGSGGTGHLAIMLAKALGVKDVTTICSKRNINFVTEFCGATNVIDYTKYTDDVNQKMMDELYYNNFGDNNNGYNFFDLILDCVTSGDPEDCKYDYPKLIQKYQNQNLQRHSSSSSSSSRTTYLYQRLGGEWIDWIRAGICRFLPLWLHKYVWSFSLSWNKRRDPRERLFWIKFPNSSNQLDEITKLVDLQLIKPKISKIYKGLNTTNIQNAFDDITSRRVQGKIVIQVVFNEK